MNTHPTVIDSGVHRILIWGGPHGPKLRPAEASNGRKLGWGFGPWEGAAPVARRFCLYLNASDSYSCNSIWVDTL